MDLTIPEIQAILLQTLESAALTPDQRFAIKAAIDSLEFLRIIGPGLRKVVNEHGTKRGLAVPEDSSGS